MEARDGFVVVDPQAQSWEGAGRYMSGLGEVQIGDRTQAQVPDVKSGRSTAPWVNCHFPSSGSL